MSLRVAVGIVAAVAIVVVVGLFVGRVATESTSEVLLPTAGGTDGSGRVVVSGEAGLAALNARLESILQGAPDLAPLDSKLRESFIRDVSALVATWSCGSQARYLELMNAWGGKFRFDEGQGVPGAKWRDPTDDLAVASVLVGKTTCRVVPEEELDKGVRLPPSTVAGRPGALTMSMIDFGVSPLALISAGGDTAEVVVPITTNDGTEIEVRMWMVWSESLGRWIPCFADLRGEIGRPLPNIIF